MTTVFIHGVPDTHHLWDPIRARLGDRRGVALSLPGFGSPRPSGFDASKESYVAFAIAAIERMGGPVDLVGHDWGANLVQRIVSLRPELVRTWIAGSGIVDAEYTWHDMAQQWQTPGVGEQMMDLMTPEVMAASLTASGIPADIAHASAQRIDGEMKDAILRLYRSALHVGAEWQPAMATVTRPALIVWGANDPFADARFAERLADRVRGELVVLPDCGHWWPVERPDDAVAAMQRFWDDHR
jgi:pimeloyl-ACP methyl ester carboxylesterase